MTLSDTQIVVLRDLYTKLSELNEETTRTLKAVDDILNPTNDDEAAQARNNFPRNDRLEQAGYTSGEKDGHESSDPK